MRLLPCLIVRGWWWYAIHGRNLCRRAVNELVIHLDTGISVIGPGSGCRRVSAVTRGGIRLVGANPLRQGE